MTWQVAPVFRSLRRNKAGTVHILLAASLLPMSALATFAVDVGNVYLAQRRLQGAADASAIAAASSIALTDRGQGSAVEMLAKTGYGRGSLTAYETGHYLRDPNIALADRFIADQAARSAVQIRLAEDVPLFFGKIISRSDSVRVVAKARAAPMDLAAFSLGSRPVAFSGGLVGPLLDALAGGALHLDDAEVASLASQTLDLLALAEALRARANLGGATFGEVFDRAVPMETLVRAMADVSPSASRLLLEDTLAGLRPASVRLSDFIDLGHFRQSDSRAGTTAVRVGILSMFRTALEVSHGSSWDVTADISVLGLANTSLRIVGGRSLVHSPQMSIGHAGNVVLRTSHSRILLQTSIATGIVGLPSLRLPIALDIAPATAQLAAIDCSKGAAISAAVSVTPSIGRAAIASYSSDFADLTTPLAFSTAKLLDTGLLKVHDYSVVSIGGASTTRVNFTREEIDAGVWKSTSTTDPTAAIASSLIRNQNLQVTTLLGPLPLANTTTQTVGSVLTLAAPALDGVFANVTRALGVGLGVADTRIDRLRCGSPILI